MTQHIKPTNEELEANINAAVAELEKPEQPEQSEEKKSDPVDSKKDVAAEQDDNADQKATEVKDESSKDEDQQTEEEKREIDWEKKFSQSSRENQIIYAQNKKMAEAFEKATKVEEPTEAELMTEYPEWEEMTDSEKKSAKRSLIQERRFKALEDAVVGFKDLDKWKTEVDSFVDNPENLQKYPLLEGKEDEFKLFAIKPTRRNVDFNDLVSAFLFDHQTRRPKNKGKMFETGSATAEKKAPVVKSDKISVEESQKLMKTNYSEYKRLLIAGKIDNAVS